MCILVFSSLLEGVGLVQLIFYAQLHLTVCRGIRAGMHICIVAVSSLVIGLLVVIHDVS
jgi:hypothetical protein